MKIFFVYAISTLWFLFVLFLSMLTIGISLGYFSLLAIFLYAMGSNTVATIILYMKDSIFG